LEKLDEGLRNKIIEALKSEPSTAREHNVFQFTARRLSLICAENSKFNSIKRI
jgi:hypothetical protein